MSTATPPLGVTPDRFQMTQEDIDMGFRCTARDCPVAKCIQRTTGVGDCAVMVDDIYIEIGDCRYDTPEEVAAFIEAFDNCRPVEPISFELYPSSAADRS